MQKMESPSGKTHWTKNVLPENSDMWAESHPKNNRCSHDGCNVPAVRIAARYVGDYEVVGIGIKVRRGYTCGNHPSDNPNGNHKWFEI